MTLTYAECQRAHAGCATDAGAAAPCPDPVTCSAWQCMADQNGVTRCVRAHDIPGC